MNLATLRKEYSRLGLRKADLETDPIRQFQKWYQQATEAELPEPNAMTLATADSRGMPTARTVLLKGVDDRGFSFFTNTRSRKGLQLAENPRASLVLFWHPLERQICIEGAVSPLPDSEADEYFQIRPRGSQLGAWASEQSQPVSGRAFLEEQLRQLEGYYANQVVPRPPHWGGYVLAPERVEFWQGRPNRLHDRLCYTRQQDGPWQIQRLAP